MGSISAGFRFAAAYILDDDGIMIGDTDTAPAAGNVDGASPFYIQGARNLDLSVPEPEIVDVFGADELMGSFAFSAGQSPRGALTKAVQQLNWDALVQDTTVVTRDGVDYGLRGVPFINRNLGLLVQKRAKNPTTGAVEWVGYFALNINVTPLGSPLTQRANTDESDFINVSPSKVLPTGEELDAVTWQATQGLYQPFRSPHPLAIKRWTGDGTETEYTLDFPIVAGSQGTFVVNGVVKTYTTHYTLATSTLTIVTPATNFAAAAKGVLIHRVLERDLLAAVAAA